MNRFKSTLMGAAAAALILTTATALAGSGVGGVFNLGQVNTVDAQTILTGNPGGNPELKVTSTGTAAAVRGTAVNGIGTNGISTSGVGQQGLSTSGTGTLGTHGGTTGISPGVQGETNSTDPAGAGVVGKNNGGGPGLKAIVNAGAPPLSVNSLVKVVNLNADLLDGLDSPAFQRRVTGICAAGSAIKTVNADGTVVCEPVGAAGSWGLTGNSGTTPGTNFLGTTDNNALELKVGGQRALRIEPTGFTPNLIGGSSFNFIPFLVVGSTIAGGGTNLPASANHTEASYDFIGAGYGNQTGTSGGNVASGVVAGVNNAATGGWSFVGAGAGNQAGADYASVAGGSGNWANGVASFIGGGSNSRVTGDYSLVGGGGTNVATNPYSAVVGGNANSAAGDYSSVVGGYYNTAGGPDSTVGGGRTNAANGVRSVVGGGYANTASKELDTVGGGYGNTASGSSSTVAGGYQNAAGGGGSTVAGGSGNAANGDYSFVAGVNSTAGAFGFALGRQAKATDNGSFVWGDSSAFDIGSNGTNTFTARSIGGARFVTGINASGLPSAGVQLPAGGGAWSSLSDRNAKERFKSVDKGALLRKLARIPIERWSYKAQGPSIVHMGPTAQDFAHAFSLGEDIRRISTVDADGVALAAIQGLYRQNQALERRVGLLEHQLQIQEGRRAR